ncbi:interferon regulatory factor 4a [Brachionichthys hirsutus]|uniref:interferon regulatory factor 4a n=1 Tax=Brachionichthys hirsutus TaxID=412623 RepID=UPI003604A3B9
MNLEEDSGPPVNCGNGKLRQWLIDQIDSRRYPGLIWETDEKSIFRIPWKHAGKQDYNREEDAALFKAWAMFKGKYKEGIDEPNPPIWKTRLRCALNKSNDFDELVERSKLDISEPYKVYRIIPEEVKKGMKLRSVQEMASHLNCDDYIPPYSSLHNQVPSYMVSQEKSDWRDYSPPDQPLPTPHQGPHAEVPYGQCHYPPTCSRAWPASHIENGFQFSFRTFLSDSQPTIWLDHNKVITDFSLHVSLYYRESLVKEATTTSQEGCRITFTSSPCREEKFHSTAEVILFPFASPESHRPGTDTFPNALEKGVLLWMTPEGLYAKRLCQEQVYWDGPSAPCAASLNKLVKELPTKLFDSQQFLIELQDFAHNGQHLPGHQVMLCFGEEYSDSQQPRKMITAKVEPVFARKLVFYYQQHSGHYLRAYDDIQEQNVSQTVDEPLQRRPHHNQE